MGLRRKTLLIIGTVVAGLLVVLYILLSSILLSSFADLEDQSTRQNVRRATDAIAQEQANLEQIANEWAAADKTYAFIDTGDLSNVQEDVDDTTLTDLRINVVFFMRYPDHLLYSKAFDLNTQQETPLPQGLNQYLGVNNPLIWHPDPQSRVSGILILPEGPLLVSSQPVLTGDRQGPIHGSMTIGRYLDSSEVRHLSDMIHSPLDIQRVDNPDVPSDYQAVLGRLYKEPLVIVQPQGGDAITAYTLLRDINGDPALILRVYTTRDVYQAAQRTLSYLFLSLLAAGLVFGEVTVFLLERLVLSRMARLSNAVSRIGTSSDTSARVSLAGKDELSSLADDINKMLAALERSEHELRQTQGQLELRVAERTTELKRLAGQLAVVNRIARAASGILQLDDLLEVAYREIASILPCDAFLIALYDQETSELDYRLQVDEGVRQPPVRVLLQQGLTAQVVSEKRPLLIYDYAAEQEHLPPAETWGSHKVPASWLGVPMSIGERVVGVISVQSYRPHAFGGQELRLLALIADQVAMAVDNARLYTATQARADELALLNEIAISLTSLLDFAAVVRTALTQIQRLFQADEVSLLQTDTTTGELRFIQTLSGTALREAPLQPAPGEGFAGWALANRRAVRAESAASDPRYSATVDRHGDSQPAALMAVPLLTLDYTIGVLELTSTAAGVYGDDELRTLQAIASTMTIALVNARLYNEVKTLLREQEQAQAQLIHAEKMAAMGRLVASIAHEINNPLQAVQFCLSLVEDDVSNKQLSEDTVAYLDTIQREVERVSAIVHRMRDFYRPAREGLQPTDLHAVLDSVLELCGRQMQHNDVTIERDWGAGLPVIQSNPDHLKQVFLNLVLNAIDAMPTGGVLRVATRADSLLAHGETLLSCVQVTFADTGIGMSPEVLSHLFEPFFTTKEHGSGLGLSISYSILQALNGQISVSSVEGQGSTFTIQLPVSPL
jgi:signal transduction histidine kinase/HAMP domain-containing protein